MILQKNKNLWLQLCEVQDFFDEALGSDLSLLDPNYKRIQFFRTNLDADNFGIEIIKKAYEKYSLGTFREYNFGYYPAMLCSNGNLREFKIYMKIEYHETEVVYWVSYIKITV